MGYDKDEDGNLIINEEQAQVLRRIFQMFLMGQTPESIARRMNYEGGDDQERRIGIQAPFRKCSIMKGIKGICSYRK